MRTLPFALAKEGSVGRSHAQKLPLSFEHGWAEKHVVRYPCPSATHRLISTL